ncbi:hypothetical protein [Sphingomonas sp. PWP1-2]|uniref:hypothetical protein n=1 Tax=Sphingomonas sp. PWP1-2 TaxID=2804558 RepID=UPI003CF30CF5
MRKVRIDMAGLRYARLLGVDFSHTDRHGHCHWLFACDCGTMIVAHGGNVRAGSTTSCGCRHREISAARLRTHGERADKRHAPTYRAWQAMKSLCDNPKVSGYPQCGGRGIAVAARWRDDFPAFLADMGERPLGMTLRRDDAQRDFGPNACHWAVVPTRAERAARSRSHRHAEV